ncbi:MAG: GIY-YIG nuclease family protein [Patescibacteria group bacterium]
MLSEGTSLASDVPQTKHRAAAIFCYHKPPMHEYFVYILRCRDGSYYTGVTNDLEERIRSHERGDDRAAYTYLRRPVKLVYKESFQDINDAILHEKQIQGWSRKKKEALIAGNFEKLHVLAMNKKNREKFGGNM